MSTSAAVLTETLPTAKALASQGFFPVGGNQSTSKQRDLKTLMRDLLERETSLQAEIDQYSEKLVRLQDAIQEEFELMERNLTTLISYAAHYHHAENSVKTAEYVEMLKEDAPRREEQRKEFEAAIIASNEKIRQCDAAVCALLKNESNARISLAQVKDNVQTLRDSQEKSYPTPTGMPLSAEIAGYYANLQDNIRAREDQIDALLENYKNYTALVEECRLLEALTQEQQEEIESFQPSFIESMENIKICEDNIKISMDDISKARANLGGAEVAEVSAHSPETHHHSDSANSSDSEGAHSDPERTQSDSEETEVISSTRRLSM